MVEGYTKLLGISPASVKRNHLPYWTLVAGKMPVLFFIHLSGGDKNSKEFYNSLKNCRDRFDSWLSDIRVGWRNEDKSPCALPAAYKAGMGRMER